MMKHLSPGNQLRASRKTRALQRTAAAVCLGLAPHLATAASGTWTGGGTNGNWTNPDNWNVNPAPGVLSGTTNADVAYFNTNPANRTVNLDGPRNLKSITFDTNAGSYAIGAAGGNPLSLSSGGIINIVATVNSGGGTQTVKAPLLLQSASASDGTYTFDNRAAANWTLRIDGNVSGGVATGKITLNLGAANGSTANEISGSISDGNAAGGLAIVKSNNGMWILSGSNTFSGGVTISSGGLFINNANALGTGVFTIANNNASIRSSSGNAIKLATNNAQAWNSNFNFVVANDLNLGSGNVTLGTNVAIRSQNTVGALTVGGNIDDGGAGYGLSKITDAGELILTGNLTYKGATMVSGGTLTLSGSNRYEGGTTAASNAALGARLNLNNANALGSGILALGGTGPGATTLGNTSGAAVTLATNNSQTWNGSFAFSGPSDLNLGTGAVTVAANHTLTVSGGTLTVGGNISGGSVTFTKAGTGVLVLGGSNTFGATTVSSGVLRLENANALPGGIANGSGTANLTLNGGVLELTDASGDFTGALGTGAGNVQFGANGGGFSAYDGDRAVNLGGSGAVLSWGGTGWNSGAKLVLSSSSAQATVDFQNAINLNNNGARTVQVENGSADIDAKLSGAISNSSTGGLTKTGDGTLSVTGNNSYQGTTAVNGGRLVAGHAFALGSGMATVASGAALEVAAGVSGFENTVELNGGTFVYNGSSDYIAGNVTLASGGVLKGSGRYSGYLELNGLNQILDPGDRVTRGTGVMTFAESDRNWSAFSYRWNLKNFGGTTAGSDFSRIDIEGSLTLDLGGSYLLTVTSLLGDNSLGNVVDFSEGIRTWTILTASDGIFDFDAHLWNIDTSAFSAAGGWIGGWSLAVSPDDQSLLLTYAVPEPSVLGLVGAAGLLACLARRRRRE